MMVSIVTQGCHLGWKMKRVDFQESMNKAFESLIGRIVKVYVDDNIVRSKGKDSAPDDLK